MQQLDSIKNIIESERGDLADILKRIENALTWPELRSDLRKSYEAECPYLRLVIGHLDYLINCCQRWQTSRTQAPKLSKDDLERDLNDGHDWPEEMFAEDLRREIPEEERRYLEYICRCSRRWRLAHHADTMTIQSMIEIAGDQAEPIDDLSEMIDEDLAELGRKGGYVSGEEIEALFDDARKMAKLKSVERGLTELRSGQGESVDDYDTRHEDNMHEINNDQRDPDDGSYK